MFRAKNYETVATSVKVMQRKLVASFFPDTVYISACFDIVLKLYAFCLVHFRVLGFVINLNTNYRPA